MRRKSDYTDEDRKAAEEWMEKNPDCFHWTTLEGLRLPMHMIKDGHLKNIITHMHEVNMYRTNFSPLMIRMFEAELKYRQCKTPAGKVLFGKAQSL